MQGSEARVDGHISNGRQVYSSESPLIHPRRLCRQALQDLRGSVDAARRLFRRNIAQRYRYSSLGLFWAFAPSAVIAAVLTAGQRGHVSILSTTGVPPQLYAIFGMVMAQTFLESFNTQRSLFTANRHLFNRNRFAIEGMILAGIGDNLFSLVLKIPVLAAVFFFCGITPALTLPLGLISLGGILFLGTILGMFLAPWNALKQDIENIMSFFPWLLFALTPVFVQPKPGTGLSSFYRWNPLAWVFNSTRAFTYGHASGYGWTLVLLLLFVIISLPCAWLLCRIARPYVVERFLI